MIKAIHSAMPRAIFNPQAHTAGRPSVITTPQVQLPAAYRTTADVMAAPQREAVISNAGAAFWAGQALRSETDDSRHQFVLAV